jgi:hypothetical protein
VTSWKESGPTVEKDENLGWKEAFAMLGGLLVVGQNKWGRGGVRKSPDWNGKRDSSKKT